MNKLALSVTVFLLTSLTLGTIFIYSPARNTLLGLMPKEAVLNFADKIDVTRMENIKKISTLENKINEQEQLITDLKNKFEEQKKVVAENQQTSEPKPEVKAKYSTAEISSACSKVTYYEKSYSSKDKAGKSISFTKGEGNISKYHDLRGWIRDHYKGDDDNWEGGVDAVISNIEKDYKDYLNNKEICK